VHVLQEAADTALVKEITKHADNRQALRWLAQELAWERVLTNLRDEDDTVAPPAARAA
jgi:hypothetical protein